MTDPLLTRIWNRIVGPAALTAFLVVAADLILMKQMELAGVDRPTWLIVLPAGFFILCQATVLWRRSPGSREAAIGAIIGLYFGGVAYTIFDRTPWLPPAAPMVDPVVWDGRAETAPPLRRSAPVNQTPSQDMR
jgi:hypothetical protein